MSNHKRKIAMLLATMVMLSTLTGCSNNDKAVSANMNTPTATVIPLSPEQTQKTVSVSTEVIAPNASLTEGLDATQLNSINMLNYLVVLTQEINASKNSRLYLEEAYSALLNNTSPEVVDNRTLVEINYLLDTLESYRMTSVKRDRLQYIYEQNKAQALRDAVPGPLGLMSAVQSFSLSKMIASVVYMAVDSYTSYESGAAQADLQYLQDGWALDDEEETTLHQIRKGTLNYMVETVRDYKLPGKLSLTEQAVTKYVEWKNKSNILQVIQFFEENVDIYQGFGPYWLTLAECYYKNGDYGKCLSALTNYQAMQTGIFRRDYAYARVLPLGVVAAQEVYDKKQYVETAEAFISDILKNTASDDWTLRYFAAQTYIELSGLTGNQAYLQEAYNIALNNVNYLLDNQKALNTEYLAAVQEAPVPAGATDAEKKEIKQYNKLLKEERKTALPPVHEPLLLNCELLFSLADELGISDAEAARVDGILHENGAAIFLIEPLDALYRMEALDINYGEQVTFDGSKIRIPATLVAENASITLAVTYEGEEILFNDWTVEKVERKTESDISTFTVTYTSKALKDYNFKAGAQIKIRVIPKPGTTMDVILCVYDVVATKKLYVFDGIEFQRAEE